MSTQLERSYSTTGRPPIAPEQLLRALRWKVPYGIEGERLLMEELDYNLLLPVGELEELPSEQRVGRAASRTTQ